MDVDERSFKERELRLERWKLGVAILTPLVLLVLTFVVNNTLQTRAAEFRRNEQILAEKQRIYGELGGKLNIIYVYIDDVGDFRSYTPPQIIAIKREVDRQFFAYLPYWSDKTRGLYKAFIIAAFAESQGGRGNDAPIKADTAEKIAAYESVPGQKWNWDRAFFKDARDPKIRDKYYALVNALLADIVSPKVHEK